MDSLDREIRFLDRVLRYWEESCMAWCTKEGLEFTTGARLAHYILDHVPLTHRGSHPTPDILPRPSRDEAAWRALLEWRHPQINLNLLQLAIVFDNYFLQKILWQPMFLQEQDYRDDSSQLVNHPLHLHCRISGARVINLDYIRDELFYEEGLIDLTHSRMLTLTQTESSVSASGLPNSSVLEVDISPPFHHALEKMVSHMTTSANSSLFHQSESMRLAPLYDLNNVLNVVGKLSGPRAQPSTVELIWAIATSTTNAPRSHCSEIEYFVNILPIHNEELLILLCQCTFTATDAKLREKRLDDLSEFFWKLSRRQNVQTEKAVKFLSRNALEKTIRRLQNIEAAHSHCRYKRICRRPPLSEVLKDQLASRTLQDLCVLTVMEAVRGDAGKVWSLEQLPEPLMQLFHVPFQETYQELKAGEEDWISPSDFP